MDLQQIFSMVGGDNEHSYVTNSILQKVVISKAKPFVDEVVEDLYAKTSPQNLTIADLGCASSLNSLKVVSNIIETVNAFCCTKERSKPEFQVYLNDLPSNDFNILFKMVSAFYGKLKEDQGKSSTANCFISGTPGSFYERLFPRKTLWLVHSSYSLHWLSQVPQGIENNKENIFMAKTSPPEVFKAYFEQFQKDFSSFLCLRAEEIICGGRMVLTITGRKSLNPASSECCRAWELLAEALNYLVSQGCVEEDKVYSFNVPLYTPCTEELRDIITKEGSFDLNFVDIFEVNWDANEDSQNTESTFNKTISGKSAAKTIRAVIEPLLVCHFGFGDEILNNLFVKYAELAAEHLAQEKTKQANVIMSMTRKASGFDV